MFFDIIQNLCDKSGISVSKLALDLKISKSNVTNWKNGSIPKMDKVSQIANYFDVTTDYLTENEQKNKPSSFEDSLTDEEFNLIMEYRKLTQEEKNFVRKSVSAQSDK